jgi:hypothetical protein
MIPSRQPATGSGKEGSYRPEPSDDIRKFQPSQGHLESLSCLIEESEHFSDEDGAGSSGTYLQINKPFINVPNINRL